VSGSTMSYDFPTKGGYRNVHSGAYNNAYLTRLELIPNGSNSVLTYTYSTYLGGYGDDHVYKGISLVGPGKVVIAGATSSSNFPVANAFQSTYGGGLNDGWIAKFDT